MICLNAMVSRITAAVTNEKVHNSDMKSLAKNIELVHQGVSEFVEKRGGSGWDPHIQKKLDFEFETLKDQLECASGEINHLNYKLRSSSYNHNELKGQRLESLAAKVTDARSKLEGDIEAKKQNDINMVDKVFNDALFGESAGEE
ncbi:hypothetical protein [Pseudomonas sp. PDM27]|uniref:hypothetical protein n=1 Tax=Pseudomonas sp. PDM27 TaxID=2854769 RepID=UPI001C43C2AF|nr:hypothetical protein [Pseudomonas sp. PDM27]MBV7567601.1 hypothetical protein [Pseudomonas sp. PDM27]